MKIGANDINKIMLGGSEISKIMLGTSQVYSGGSEPTPPTPVPYDEQYFTIESLEHGDNTISFTMGDRMTTAITTAVTSVSVSTDDGQSWTSMENIGARASLSVTLSYGEKAIWKGEAVRYALGSGMTGQGRQTIFSSTGQFKVYGNIMSLISGDTFEGVKTLTGALTFCGLFRECTGLTSVENLVLPATTLTNYCYNSMFRDCTSLTTAPELPAATLTTGCYNNMFNGCASLRAAPELPATTLASNCYGYMFTNCTSLTTAPSLPATTLAESCYMGMFAGCTSLVNAPELPATALTNYCYNSMFSGCTSLTTAPELPAATLTTGCYNSMFYSCGNLNYIKCLATDISATDCTYNWVSGVSSTGTFVKNAAMNSWTTGTGGIPDDWTVQNDDGSPVISLKYTATYTDGTVVTASCNDSGSVLVIDEISKTNLKTVVLGECVTTISGECFSDCRKLESVTIEGNTTIDSYSFARNNGTLKTIRMKATTPPQCDSSAFKYYKSGSGYIPMESIRIYVPSASVSRYKEASGWNTYSSKIYGY